MNRIRRWSSVGRTRVDEGEWADGNQKQRNWEFHGLIRSVKAAKLTLNEMALA